MLRTTCVICKKSPLDSFYTMKKFPLLTLPMELSQELDILHDYEYGICSQCQSVQLLNLVDPLQLYNYPNKSSLTPLWEEHHREFVNFIEKYSQEEKEIWELGGANNPLYQYFQKEKKYSVLDLHEPKNKDLRIIYKVGNIETFEEYTCDTLLLSHTFEHLYNPELFLKHIEISSVNHVFISVPNMSLLLRKKNSVSIVFSEHTFYFEAEDIMYMFATHGFACKSFNTFKDHSLFFYFFRETTTVPKIHMKEEAKELFLDHFHGKEKRIQSIHMNEPFYIMPSHYIGQMVYFFCNQKELVLGFLDNDKNKTEKRLYGTHCKTFLPNSELLENQTVILVSNPYKKEMKEQLRLLSSTVKILECEI